MIGTLVRFDLTRRKLLVWAFVMAIAVIPVVVVPAQVDAMLMGALSLPALFILAFSGLPNQRATHFEAALPIPARQIFLAQMLSRLAMVGAVALLWVLVIAARLELAWPLVLYTAEGAAALALAILVPSLVRPRELVISMPLVVSLLTALLVAIAVAVVFLPQGIVLALLALAITAAFLRAWHAIPAAFQTAPLLTADGAVAKRERVVANDRQADRIAARFPWWPAFRSVLSWQEPMFFAVMVLQGLGGGMFYFLFIFCAQAAMFSRQRARWMYALPLSYRTLMCLALASSVLPVLGGLAVGTALRFSVPVLGYSQVGTGPSRPSGAYDWSKTNVPLTFWHVVRGGVEQIPVEQSPWGETITPATIPLAGFTFYNPYYTSKTSSPRMLEWQLARATETVYGKPIPLSELETGAPPAVTEQPRMLGLSTAALLVFVLYVLLCVELSMWYPLRRPSARVLRVAVPLLCWAPVLAVSAIDFWFMIKHGGQLAVPLVQAGLLQMSRMLPQNMAVLLVVAAIPVVAMYLLLERQFGKAELAWQVGGQ